MRLWLRFVYLMIAISTIKDQVIPYLLRLIFFGFRGYFFGSVRQGDPIGFGMHYFG